MIRESTINKYIGKRYGRVVVEAFARKDPRNRHHYFFVGRCDCGTRKEFRISTLQQGSQSCGCYRSDNNKEIHSGNTYRRLGRGEAACNHLYKRYQGDAAKRNLPFKLTRDDFVKLTSAPCFYCDCGPSSVRKARDNYGEYRYNGIDRVDNAIGYVPENCVPCCAECNSVKNGINKEMVRRLYHKLFKR